MRTNDRRISNARDVSDLQWIWERAPNHIIRRAVRRYHRQNRRFARELIHEQLDEVNGGDDE